MIANWVYCQTQLVGFTHFLLLQFEWKCRKKDLINILLWLTIELEEPMNFKLNFDFKPKVLNGSNKPSLHTILRYCDKKIISSHMFQWPTKVSYEKIHLDFLKSLPWPIEIHGPKIYFYRNIFLSKYLFYRNIVCGNVSCE